MNDSRRKQLEGLALTLQEILESEQEALDNMPESLQLSERGECMEEVISSLSYAVDLIETASL